MHSRDDRRRRERQLALARPDSANCRGRSARQLGLAALILCFPAAIPIPTAGQTEKVYDSSRFWDHESEFSGARACKACHAEIYDRQEASNHSASLRPVGQVPELTAELGFELFDRASGYTLSLSEDSSGEVHLRAANDTDSSTAGLSWAFGSAKKGVTPLGRTETGRWVESRLTWYASLGAVDFTTGASKYDPKSAAEGLGRGLSDRQVAECFGCHTTGYDERSEGPGEQELGIRCERCHGPGLGHVEAASAGRPIIGTIFNPGILGGFEQARMCGTCHGVPPQDNDFDMLALLERMPHSVRFPTQRIVLSRCFNETFGELACTTCHNPHLDVADEAASFDAACRSCHGPSTRENAAVCGVGSANCASCHMPKERVMRHTAFSDHWIRVVAPD